MQIARDIATCMYYTGLDPFTRKPVQTARDLKDRKLQRALMQFFKPENYFEVREALIPAQPPREAIEARRRRANAALRNDHYHSVANPSAGERRTPRVGTKGYRPGRMSQVRRPKPGRGPKPHGD